MLDAEDEDAYTDNEKLISSHKPLDPQVSKKVEELSSYIERVEDKIKQLKS